MKKLIVVLGPNAVGKSTVCKTLLDRCPNSAWIDGDWCRQINPYPFTNATKKTVTENLYAMIHNYLNCEDIQWVFFPYSLHGEREEIFREICDRLDHGHPDVQIHTIVLKASMEELISRGKTDGRNRERIERGILHTYSLYEDLSLPSVDTTELSVEETADAVYQMIGNEPAPLPKKKRNLKPLLALLMIPVIAIGFLIGRCSVADPVTERILPATEPTLQTAEVTTLPATLPTMPPTQPSTEASTEEYTHPSTEATAEASTQAATEAAAEETSASMDYVVNKSSLKFHYPECESVAKMKESNKEFFTGTREELLERGCDPCGNCNP